MITKIKNFFLCLKYPFLKSRNVFTGRFLGYESTWYDHIPVGWQKAFGKKFCKKLKTALKKDKASKSFRFEQIKEKYGSLHIYAHGFGKESNKVIAYYEELSKAYCINCGMPVRYITDGWINYLCEDCAFGYLYENKKLRDIDSIVDALEKLRLTENDISIWNCSDEEMQALYNSFDWNKLWGLEENGK